MDLRNQNVRVSTAIILCGGQARRLGGVEKPLQAMAGQPLIERVIEQIQPQVPSLLISANRALDDYRRLAAQVVDDGEYAYCGPLAGIAAGLAASAAGLVLCVPGDAPRLPPDLLARLSTVRDAKHVDLAYVDDGNGPQPLCCLLDTALLPDLRNYLDAGGRTPRHWFARHTTAAANFDDWPRWAWSTNTAAEWLAAERHLGTETPA